MSLIASGQGRKNQQWLLVGAGVGATGLVTYVTYQWWLLCRPTARPKRGPLLDVHRTISAAEEVKLSTHGSEKDAGDAEATTQQEKPLLPGQAIHDEASRTLKAYYEEHAANRPREARSAIMVEFRMRTVSQKWNAKGLKCDRCWLIKETCVCKKLEPLNLPVDFIVYMHTKEYHRASNTGRLIAMSHPSSVVLISGLAEDEERVQQMYAEDPDNVVILFPSLDAVTMKELTEEREAKGIKGRLRVILPDGTWRQARACVRRLPKGIRKVKIGAAAKSRNMLRTRTREDGICSIEAAATLIQDLNEPEQAAIMIRHLEKLNEAVIAQTGTHKASKFVRLKEGNQQRQEREPPAAAGASSSQHKPSEETFRTAEEEDEEGDEEGYLSADDKSVGEKEAVS